MPKLAIEEVVGMTFPWCSTWAAELKELFAAYVDASRSNQSTIFLVLFATPTQVSTLPYAGRQGSSTVVLAEIEGTALTCRALWPCYERVRVVFLGF